MARPTLTQVDMWTVAASYGDRPPFAYMREKLPDYDGEKRFSIYTGHEAIRDRLWVAWFVRSEQAVLWLEWNAVDLIAATAAEGDEARALARSLSEKPSGVIGRHIGRGAAR